MSKPNETYQILQKKYGNLNWWPIDKSYHLKNNSDPRFEVIVGTILTQNTAWSNVEKALKNLKKYEMLDLKSIYNCDLEKLAKIIQPSGFFNQKAGRLRNIGLKLKELHNSDLNSFFDRDINIIRDELLSYTGIGPETADSIILYAGEKPIFVVDAYTKRLCQRLPFKTDISYDSIQNYFQKELSKKYKGEQLTKVYNQLHALIVIHAKEHCRKKPKCNKCPLSNQCSFKKSF